MIRDLRLAPLLILIAAVCTAPVSVHASCFSDVLGDDGRFADQIERDPNGAIALIEAELSSQGRGAGFSAAHLYAMLLDAYRNAGNVAAARDAAARGIEALTAADSDGLRRRLQLTAINLLVDQGQLERASAEYEQASGGVPDNAPDLVCVLGDRGFLRFLIGRKVDAALDATRAYRLAGQIGKEEIRLRAGQLLARLYSQVGLYDDALALADAPIEFYSRSSNKERLADAYLFRGDVYVNKQDYAASDIDFLKSQALLQDAGDRVGLSYTQRRLCNVAARMPDRPDASAVCHEAYEAAKALEQPVNVKMALAGLGMIEFGKGHPRAAVDLWDRALAADGVDIPKLSQSEILHLRSRARAQLGDPLGALRDANRYIQSIEDEQKNRSADQLALLNVKFETALKDEELARVRAEARAAELATSRQASIRNLLAAAAALVVLTLFLGTSLWHRRKLAIKAHEAAEERLAAIGRLTGGIAHDFNNLLTVLEQAVGLLAHRESVAGDAAAVDLVRQARQASQICADITSQLLSFSQQQNLNPETIEFDRYMHDVLPLLERTAGTAVNVRVETQPAVPVAWVDRRQLTAALLNLATNARDAMSNGGALIVRVSGVSDRRIRIDVIDEGCGMAPDARDRAIEPFYTTKPMGYGFGLGLSMVQGFVTQSGGTMAIASAPNRGTTVSMWLPVARSST